MAGRRVDALRHPRRGPIAPAIVRRAQIRPALHDLARDLHGGRPGVVARVALAAARIVDRAARALDFRVLLVPIRRPFPDVAGHVVEAVAVRRERADRRGPLEAVLEQVLPRELALPEVRVRLAARRELVAPAILRAVEAAARGELPLGFARQLLAGPPRVGLRVLERDVHDGVIPEPLERAV